MKLSTPITGLSLHFPQRPLQQKSKPMMNLLAHGKPFRVTQHVNPKHVKYIQTFFIKLSFVKFRSKRKLPHSKNE